MRFAVAVYSRHENAGPSEIVFVPVVEVDEAPEGEDVLAGPAGWVEQARGEIEVVEHIVSDDKGERLDDGGLASVLDVFSGRSYRSRF